jgi:hypothetical protein
MNASKLAVGSTPIVSGTVGRLLFQGTGNVLGQNSFLFWDNSNTRLGVGTNTPLYTLDVAGNIHGNGIFAEYNIVTTSGNVWLSDGYAIGDYGTGNNRIEFYNNRISLFGNGNEAMRIVGSTQNVLIGTTTDAGYKLNVNGTARIQNVLTVSSPGFTAFSTANTFAVDTGSNNYRTVSLMGWNQYHAGSGTNNTLDAFAVGGNTSSSSNGSYFFRVNLSGGNSGGIYGSSGNNTSLAQLNAPTTSNFYVTAQGNGGLVQGSTNGFLISTISDGSNLSLRSEKGTGGGGGGINYLSSINGSNHSHRFFHNNVEQMRLQYSGNLLINTTTDAGYKLDVNGTARVSGNLTLTNGSLILSSYYTVGDGTYSLRRDYLLSYDPFRIYTVPNQVPLYLGSGVINTCVVLNGVNDTQRGFGIADDGTPSLLNSAVLQLNSTKRGFLPPRMTNAQRAAIASPAVGLIVYCTDATEGLYVYKSTGWTFMV